MEDRPSEKIATENTSYPMYDNFTAGFVPPSHMLHPSGYQIPYPYHLHSGYQPPFMPTQLSQQGIAQLWSSHCRFYALSAKDLNQPYSTVAVSLYNRL